MRSLFLILSLVLSLSAFPKAIFDTTKNSSLFASGPNFIQSCSMGLIHGCEVVTKFGINGALASGVERDVWDFGETTNGDVDYTYPPDGTAPITTVSSSNALDLQPVLIQGLDINGDFSSQNITANGQNKVLLTTPLWRVFRIKNLELQSTADRTKGFNGNFYVYEDTAIVAGVPTDDTKVRAWVNNGKNQTQMTHYCIPNGYTGFMVGGSAKTAKKLASAIIYRVYKRNYGSIFRLVNTLALVSTGTGSYTTAKYVPVKTPGKTDIVVTAESDVNGVGIAVSYDILLLKNSVFGL